ncbi:MAG: LicD family protein [Cyanobacteria bacterium SIG28]|nr:LicD family protein [Cyanobacteria bacterium SIG28]
MVNKIFSVSDYNQTHKLIYIMGIKIKFPKSEYAKLKKENSYYYYKENNIDITTIPPAEGQIRDIQLANLALLKEMDFVCKQNNLDYWLDAGTLIGAMRHKGFIPWDDDIDTAMPRIYYEKIIDAFKKSSRNPDIYADYARDKNDNYMIKIQHKKCPYLFVDIFPFDDYGKETSTQEELEETKRIKAIIKSEINHSLSNEELKNKINQIMKTQIIQGNDFNKTFVWGIDYHHQWNNWFTHHDVVYPLKTISFEGYEFPCLNDPDAFLTRVYKNYMAYPSKIGFGHSAYAKLSNEDKHVIKELIRGL